MRKSLKLILAITGLLALTACNPPEDQLKDYVAQSIGLDNVSSSTLSGKVIFTKIQYYTVYENQCDTVQCGWDNVENCDYETVCNDLQIAAEDRGGGFGGYHGGGDDDGGGEHGYPGGGYPGGGYPGGFGGGACYSVPVNCQTYQEPRYCDVNCRQVPVQHSRKIDVESPITATVIGADAKDLELAVGVKTNGAFVAALENPTARPAKSAFLFDTLQKTDKTVLVLKSKQYKLVPNQNFLQLPANFAPGSAIELNIQVEKVDNPNEFSSTGTPTDLPDLTFIEH